MYVYITGRGDGRQKIGFSSDPQSRARHIGPGFQVIHAISTSQPRWLERYLHQAYRHRHLSTEWFALLDAEIDMLRAVLECHSLADVPLFIRALHLAHAANIRVHLNGRRCTVKIVRPRLRAARIAAGMSQFQLGRLIGLSGAFISEVETGRTEGTAAQWESLAAALGEPARELSGKKRRKAS